MGKLNCITGGSLLSDCSLSLSLSLYGNVVFDPAISLDYWIWLMNG